MKCSISGCGLCQSKNRPNLTFHRLPSNESRRREWLEKIGIENIRPGTKNINVCSLHFEESAFNKTLNLVRLRDDAIPTIFTKADRPSQFASIDRENTIDQPSCSGYTHPQRAKDLELADRPSQFALIDRVNTINQPSCSGYTHPQHAKDLELADRPSQFALIDKANTIDQPSCSGYSHPQDAKDLELASAIEELKKMEEKVEKQKKKIKCLNEVVRQQKLKLDTFKNIIIELKEKNLINTETSRETGDT